MCLASQDDIDYMLVNILSRCHGETLERYLSRNFTPLHLVGRLSTLAAREQREQHGDYTGAQKEQCS